MKVTVKELSHIANVTIKALYHYHKIGLLVPKEISEAGYRYYGADELKRLQEILFYKELDIPLSEIKRLLDEDAVRTGTLEKQKKLFEKKIKKYQRFVQTVNTSLEYTRKGENMDHKVMFKGFETADEWKQSLAEQNDHLKEHYDFEVDTHAINVDEMNKMAIEAKHFLDGMADFLRSGVTYHDPAVQEHVMNHITFLTQNGHPTSKEDYVKQTRFFMQDDFHRGMLEEQQTGLSYYLTVVAEHL
ncbi:MerR family transcriptional regulator [Bacillus halotolerans]|uniref:MerR family transcriptional regulator n=1 Tax=Bacillus halotolerans TaxID=260554 RepID=UPI000D0206FA|nr:MerR family transcriptional regulator [Bacillus halotolerans]PRP50958.1 MerR family transcriptional regulator [Bacillus halotolerans]PRP59345.1 MerR family transcriptional regulator [Bacillus halotolerans]PRP64010.1 MerR family transcriptional regulator [Bacillus halotolerans]